MYICVPQKDKICCGMCKTKGLTQCLEFCFKFEVKYIIVRNVLHIKLYATFLQHISCAAVLFLRVIGQATLTLFVSLKNACVFKVYLHYLRMLIRAVLLEHCQNSFVDILP